jgi:two-component system, OmpR family, KDP operon response regulator KdpE
MATAKSGIRRLRILLVDDNAPGRRALAKVLEAKGFDVTAVADGTSALADMRQSPVPDFVLTDLLLPDIDGREVARAACALVPRPFVALITGWSIEPDLQDPARWDVDHVFLKPLRIDDLLAKLAEITDQGGNTRSAT